MGVRGARGRGLPAATISTAQANYDGLSAPYGSGVRGQNRGRPIAAGSLSRNAFGLYDVHGNVAELVADCYDARTTDCTRRVVCGGSWGSRPQLVRSGLSKLVRSDPPQPPQRLPRRPDNRPVTRGCEAITYDIAAR